MKLSKLASKPQIIKLTIDDEDTIAEFGEAIDFWTWDRQPLDIFMKLANSKNIEVGAMVDVIRILILDENGKPILVDDVMLPTKTMIKAMSKIVETLGK